MDAHCKDFSLLYSSRLQDHIKIIMQLTSAERCKWLLKGLTFVMLQWLRGGCSRLLLLQVIYRYSAYCLCRHLHSALCISFVTKLMKNIQ